MMKTAILAFVIFFVIVGQGVCFEDGNELLKACWETERANNKGTDINYTDALRCLEFIQGIIQMNSYYIVSKKVQKPAFCIPPQDIPIGQATSIVVKYLKNHPEKLHFVAVGLVVLALEEAFPCKGKNK